MPTITITIPGVAYYECFDPLASGMAEEMGLPTPTFKKRGRGQIVVYEDVTLEQVQEMGEHLAAMGALWLSNSDPYFEATERSRYRTLIRTGEALISRVKNERNR